MTAQSGTPGVGYLILPSAVVEAACSGVGGLERFLSPAENDARRRFRNVADSQDYAASHVLLRLLATHQLGLGVQAAQGLDISRQCPGCSSTDHGRTVLPGMSLSLSRSHGMVMAAVAPASASVGADVERVPSELFDGFDDYVLTPREAAIMGKLDVSSRMRQWVAKEAVLKAAGLGLSIPPSAVSLVPGEDRASGLRAVCPDQPLVNGLDVHPVPVTSTHLAAVSVRGFVLPVLRDVGEVLPSLPFWRSSIL
ncbi:4'-phosphopantetheinyl transferase superfamily protein [Paenarthrobacter sp. YAF11_1]|uniref:4'-phosphopantetheinyl transferase family protein n=1 Tax=Paenarthrobacter sp. YAF11_1 TaxID=3233074 RepID=UPI003F96168D